MDVYHPEIKLGLFATRNPQFMNSHEMMSSPYITT